MFEDNLNREPNLKLLQNSILPTIIGIFPSKESDGHIVEKNTWF